MARINFVELPAQDLGAAKKFYSTVFGWELQEFGPTYACTMTGDVDLGLQGAAAEASQAPLPVIAVDNLEWMQNAVIAGGGTITHAVFSFPGGRRFHFRDPNGNELAVFQEE